MNLASEVQDLRAYTADFIHCLRGHDGGADRCSEIEAAYSDDATWAERLIQPFFRWLPL